MGGTTRMDRKEAIMSFNWADEYSEDTSEDYLDNHPDREVILAMDKWLDEVVEMELDIEMENEFTISKEDSGNDESVCEQEYDTNMEGAFSCNNVNTLEIVDIVHNGGLIYTVSHTGGGADAGNTRIKIDIVDSDGAVKTTISHFESPFADDITTEVFSIRVLRRIDDAISAAKESKLKIIGIKHINDKIYHVCHTGGGIAAGKTEIKTISLNMDFGEVILPRFESKFPNDMIKEVFSMEVADRIEKNDYVCVNIQKHGKCEIGWIKKIVLHKCGHSSEKLTKTKKSKKTKLRKGRSKKTKPIYGGGN